MRKKKIIVLLSILVVIAGIGVYYYRVRLAKLPIERVTPARPLFYLHIYDVGERIKEIKSTKLWQNIKKIDVEELLEKSKFSQEQIEQYRNFKKNFSNFLSTLFWDKFFGEEIAFVVYSSAKITDLKNKSFLSLVVITRIKPEAEFLEFIYKLNKGNLKIDYEKYKKKKITLVRLPHKFNFAYTKIKDLIIISPDKKILYSFWDVFLKKEFSLSSDRSFLSLKKNLFPSSYFLGYWDVNRLVNVIKKKLVTAFPDETRRNLKILKSWRSIEKVGFALTKENNLYKGRVVYFFNNNLLSPYYANIYTTKPEKNYTLRFIPQDVISYSWSNWFDLKRLGEHLLQEVRRRSEREGISFEKADFPKNIEEVIGSFFGVKIKNINEIIGREIGGYVYNIDTEGIFPIFEFLIFIEVKNKNIVEKMINNWVKKAKLTIFPTNYEGFKINYFSSPNLNGCYCFMDRFILISLFPKLIKKSIDVYGKKTASLKENLLFKKIKFQLSGENNMVSYLNTKVFLQKIKELCRWGINWISFLRLGMMTQKKALINQVGEIEKNINEANLKIQKLGEEYQSLKKEIEELKNQGKSISSKEEELRKLDRERRGEERRKREMLEELRKKEKKLKEIENYFWNKWDLSLVNFYLKKVIYPLIDGLKEIKAEFSRTVFKKGVIVKEVYFLY